MTGGYRPGGKLIPMRLSRFLRYWLSVHWRSAAIESAPKDGTILDLYHPRIGWIDQVWWDDGHWITASPPGFTRWRLARGISQ